MSGGIETVKNFDGYGGPAVRLIGFFKAPAS
jgi:hypothetical protein